MIRFAVIGTNWITRQFVDAAHETGKYKLTAVYSRSLEQAQSFANDYRLNICSPRSMRWRKATPLTRSILPARILCISRKRSCSSATKHVICEKPLASNIEEVEAAIALARENRWCCLKRSKPPACRTSCCCSSPCRKLAKCVKPLSTTASIPRATSATDGENPNTFNPAFSNGSIMDIGFTARPLRSPCG